MTDKPQIRIRFDTHGLGDCVHAATALRLYIADGYDVAVRIEASKRWVWQVAGIPIYDGPEELPGHPYYYPDMGKFYDLSKPDSLYSKIAHFFEIEELPKLGTKEEVWARVCAEEVLASAHVSDAALNAAEHFLKGLPTPIILLHSKGTNMQEPKSIPDGVTCDLIFDLLASTGGSVITLDWDARSPTIAGHDRVRPIKPNWGHITCEQFAALCELSDLFIGIDSGPFHLANWLNIPTIMVGRKIPPVRCALPSPRATYMVPAAGHVHWSTRGPEWRFVEFAGEEATAREISKEAVSILTCRDLPHKPARTGEFVVGIPTLNRYDLLEQTLAAIEQSAVRPRQIIVIDNGGSFTTQRDIVLVRPGRNLGVAASWNLLHRMAGGPPVVLLNDDVTVAPDTFARLLADGGEIVAAIQGPNQWSCLLQRESVWQAIGDYDENFYPAYNEDTDYQRRLRLAGIEVHHALSDVSHAGSATKAASTPQVRQLIDNGWSLGRSYYARKWGGEPGSECFTTPFGNELQELYRDACLHRSDINEHLPTLYDLARQCSHVTEMGTREGNSTAALLAAQPDTLVCYENDRRPKVDRLLALRGHTDMSLHLQDVLQVEIAPTDLLFVDTYHTYAQASAELARHSGKVKHWLVFHDTTVFGERGEDGGAGLWPAIAEFIAVSPVWKMSIRATNNNGLTVLERGQ